MKVKDLIKIMQRYPDQEEELIVNWWDKDVIEELLGKDITNEQWLEAEDQVMNSEWEDTFLSIKYAITGEQNGH
jgi:hypothetical protein